MASYFTRFRNILARPRRSLCKLWYWWSPTGLFDRYDEQIKKTGIDDLYLILSFDCDTPEDTEVVSDVHERVTNLRIQPIYAVPGELLEEGDSTYRKIRDDGGVFMNHGYKMHTYLDRNAGEYRSCFFYDELSDEKIRTDIERGHNAIENTLGISPKGFRTPHFGRFQKPSQLRYLHGLLEGLNYRYSSSTDPFYSFCYGPVFNEFGLTEFPLTGLKSNPLNLLDTWGFFQAPSREYESSDFLNEVRELVTYFENIGRGIINIYGDPSHIHGEDDFFEALEHLSKSSVSTTYGHLLNEIL